jgi:outer membrane protein assembly factor BamB
MKTVTWLLIIIAAAFIGCNPGYDIKPLPPYEWSKPVCDTTLKVVWQKIISKDSSYGEARFFFEKGRYIYKYTANHDMEVKWGFFELDGNKMHELWGIKADNPNDKRIFYGSRAVKDFLLFQNKFIYSVGTTVYCYSFQGDLIWENKFDGVENKGNGDASISGFGNKVYMGSQRNNSIHITYLFEIDIEKGLERLLYTEPMENNMIGRFDPPSLYMLDNDTIATFQNRSYSQVDAHYRSDLITYNISKKEILWRKDSLDRYGRGSANPILIENNKLYYAGAFDIYCLDAVSGKLIWRQAFDNYHYEFNHTSMLLLENGLVAKSEHEEIALLDKETGAIIWENRDVGTGSMQIELYKGDLIMSSSGKATMECLDRRTGLRKWKAKAPNQCIDNRAGFGLYSFVINPKTNLLYICDNFFIQCLKLPGYD